MTELFIEVLFAPSYDDAALEVLAASPTSAYWSTTSAARAAPARWTTSACWAASLIQDRDADLEDRESMQVVSERHPTEAEWGDLIFASRVAKHVKSNAIVIAKDLAHAGRRAPVR